MNKKKLIELRCKAWGITEDEYYCNQCSDFSLEDMARAYRRGKNKGASDADYQLEGRDNEIRELKEKIEKMKCCYNCKHSRTEYEHCKTDKHEKWEMIEK